MSEARPSDARYRRFLRYYAKGLLQLGPAGRDRPGLRHTPEEWQRLELYGASVGERASKVAAICGAVIFILVAAAMIGLLFIPTMISLYPDPAKTSALVFFSCLLVTALLALGIGYPVALSAGGFIADKFAGDPPLEMIAADRLLARKARRQIWRMIGTLCGIAIPASLILVIADIDLGPVLRVMRPVAYLILALVMAMTAWRGVRSKL